MGVTGNIAEDEQPSPQGRVPGSPQDSEVCVIYGRRPEMTKVRAH